MMDTLKTLKRILNNEILLPLPDGGGTPRVKERAPEAKIKTLDISSVPVDNIAFTLDYIPNDQRRRVCFKQLSCYLDPTHEFVNKGCDLVIIGYFKQEWCVLILDLKSNKPRLRETEAQLKNSKTSVAYVLSLIATHYPNDARFERGAFREVNPTRYQKGQAKIHFG